LSTGFYDSHASNPRNHSIANAVPEAQTYLNAANLELHNTRNFLRAISGTVLGAQALFDDVNVGLCAIEKRLFGVG